NHYYIGSTNNIERRLFEHKQGKTKSLKKLLPIKLIFAQKYSGIKTARKIETKLKKFKNRKIIEQIIKERKINLGP
ncbi:MAG: GIY-YIG nuclease family protein, partial [Patescibacteria group bacterium]